MPSLYRHPDAPAGAIQSIDAELQRMVGGAVAIFRVRGDISRLVIPPPTASGRAEGLWRTTCFELFVAGDGASYREFNLSPSGQWAAYEFESHREGRKDSSVGVETEIYQENNELQFSAKIMTEFQNPAHVGLTAVIEETDGIIRYWATSFAPGEPDFHDEATRSLLLDGVSAE